MDNTVTGKILDIDLSTGAVNKKDIDAEFTRKYVGGMGFSNKILFDEVGPNVDALSPENIVVFAPGTFAGSVITNSCRTEITTKHPETGSIGTGNTGGVWGINLKKAGYGALIVRNRAEKPVYIYIENDKIEIRDAAHLWGLDTYETTSALEAETDLPPKVGIIAIGQAGENLVPYACPITERHHGANRNGSGAVMGSKNLKGVVVRGTGAIRPARPEAFKEALAEMKEREELSRAAMSMPGSYTGGPDALKRYVEDGGLRVKNYQAGYLPNFLETRGKHIAEQYDNGSRSCHACPANCFEIGEVKEGKYAGTVVARPSFCGVTCAFGANCAVDNIPAILKCKELCQRYGMDYVGASCSIAFAMELYQRGIITRTDTDGLDLSWGNEDAVIELLHKIARREGFGEVLAQGCLKASARIGKGSERYAMTTKGTEIMEGDPRSHQKIYVLCHITNPRGGDNIKGGHNAVDPDTYDPNWWSDKFDMFDEVKERVFKTEPGEISTTWEGKALYTKWLQDLYTLQSVLGLNLSGRLTIGPHTIAKLYSAFTGIDTTPEEIMQAGERIFNVFKAFAVREGQSRKDDFLPDRFFDEPLPDGPQKGAVLSRDDINRALDEYYEVRGWDKKSGLPTGEKLNELGLDDIADQFSQTGKLP